MAEEALAGCSDEDLVAALRAGDRAAPALLFDRYADYVECILIRVLGVSEPERADLLQDVFVQILQSIDSLRSAQALKGWMATITLFTARRCLRRRTRHRWLTFTGKLPDVEAPPPNAETQEQVRCFYRIMERLPTDERILFILRNVEGMDWSRLSETLGVSVATARRRVDRAEKRFKKLARQWPALLERLEGRV